MMRWLLVLSMLAISLDSSYGQADLHQRHPEEKFDVQIRAREDPFVFSPLAKKFQTGRKSNDEGSPDYRAWLSEVEFYIDDSIIAVNHFDEPFGTYDLQLAKGMHIFRFSVTVISEGEGRSTAVTDDDCVGRFEVTGPVVLQPRLVFVLIKPGPNKAADSLDCTLDRIPS